MELILHPIKENKPLIRQKPKRGRKKIIGWQIVLFKEGNQTGTIIIEYGRNIFVS